MGGAGDWGIDVQAATDGVLYEHVSQPTFEGLRCMCLRHPRLVCHAFLLTHTEHLPCSSSYKSVQLCRCAYVPCAWHLWLTTNIAAAHMSMTDAHSSDPPPLSTFPYRPGA